MLVTQSDVGNPKLPWNSSTLSIRLRPRKDIRRGLTDVKQLLLYETTRTPGAQDAVMEDAAHELNDTG